MAVISSACSRLCSLVGLVLAVALLTPGASAQTKDDTPTPDITLARRSGANEVTVDVSRQGTVDVVVRAAARRKVLDRLFASHTIQVKWHSDAKAFSERTVNGRFAGSVEEIARRLLAGSDYFMTFSDAGGKSRLSRVVVLGLSQSSQKAQRVGGAIARWSATSSNTLTPQQRVAAAIHHPERGLELAHRRSIELARRRQEAARNGR